MKLISHRLKMAKWEYQQSDVQNGLWKGYIERSELLPLVHSSYQTMSSVVIIVFIERWYPKTNTFHMPFMEMTIMLDDVNTLLDIPVVGKTVSLSLANEA